MHSAAWRSKGDACQGRELRGMVKARPSLAPKGMAKALHSSAMQREGIVLQSNATAVQGMAKAWLSMAQQGNATAKQGDASHRIGKAMLRATEQSEGKVGLSQARQSTARQWPRGAWQGTAKVRQSKKERTGRHGQGKGKVMIREAMRSVGEVLQRRF